MIMAGTADSAPRRKKVSISIGKRGEVGRKGGEGGSGEGGGEGGGGGMERHSLFLRLPKLEASVYKCTIISLSIAVSSFFFISYVWVSEQPQCCTLGLLRTFEHAPTNPKRLV